MHELDRVPRGQGLVFTFPLSPISLVSGVWLVCREHLLHDYLSPRTRSKAGVCGCPGPRSSCCSLLCQSHLEEDPTAQGVSQMRADFLGLTAPGCGHVAPVESVSCSIISRTGCLDPSGAPVPVPSRPSWSGAERPPRGAGLSGWGSVEREEVANAWPNWPPSFW